MIDRKAVAKHFSRAASSYDAAAVLQQEVANRLAERLPLLKLQPDMIVDMGAGTGFLSQCVREHYAHAQLHVLDLSEPMIQTCRAKFVSNQPWWKKMFSAKSVNNTHFMNADAYQLPFADQSMDMIVSSLMLQWCDELPRVLTECRRVLKPNGVLFLASLGPDTLKEIRLAWQSVEGLDAEHTLQFADIHQLGDALAQAGFSDPVCDMELLTLTYETATAAVVDLKAIGATNARAQRQKGLMGKRKWQSFLEAYTQQAMLDGRIPATFEVVYAHAFVTEQALQVLPAPKTASIPVSSIKRWQG